jgi:hypothetical protein
MTSALVKLAHDRRMVFAGLAWAAMAAMRQTDFLGT